MGDLYEVESGLATTKASSPEVRRFAEMMIEDHTATTEQLKQILSTTTPAVALPMQPDARRQMLLSELMMLEGAEFDRRYVAQQTDAHREAVMLMEGFAERGDQQDLKQFGRENNRPKFKCICKWSSSWAAESTFDFEKSHEPRGC